MPEPIKIELHPSPYKLVFEDDVRWDLSLDYFVEDGNFFLLGKLGLRLLVHINNYKC